jgi:hypothetical protein
MQMKQGDTTLYATLLLHVATPSLTEFAFR